MQHDTSFDAALAGRWSEAAAVSRSIAAAAAAIAVVPPMLTGHAPRELTTVLTNAKMRMLSWPFSVAPELASLVGRVIDAGNLAPMLDCDTLERQLAERIDADRVTVGLASVVGMVANVVRGQHPAAEAVVERIALWRREIDETREQLLAIRGDVQTHDAALRSALDLLGASIGRFGDSEGSPAARPRVVLVWLSTLEPVAFGLVAEDESAAAVAADRQVLDASRIAAAAYAAANESTRWQALLDAALSILGAASADARGLELLASDTAAAWQPVVERLARTSSGAVPESRAAIRSLIEQARGDVQCVHDVQQSFRAASAPMTPIVTEPIQLRPAGH